MTSTRLRRIDEDGVIHYAHYGERDYFTPCRMLVNQLPGQYHFLEGFDNITCLLCLSLDTVFCDSPYCYNSVSIDHSLCSECVEGVLRDT